jgi:DnaJ-class molecular chaperone
MLKTLDAVMYHADGQCSLRLTDAVLSLLNCMLVGCAQGKMIAAKDKCKECKGQKTVKVHTYI